MQQLIHRSAAVIVPLFIATISGCQTLSRGPSPAIVLNQGAAYPQTSSLLKRPAQQMTSDQAGAGSVQPSLSRSGSRVVPMPLPAEENPQSQSDLSLTGSGYRAEDPGQSRSLNEVEESHSDSASSESDSVPVPSVRRAEASIVMDVDSPAEVQVNGEVRYVIRLTNNGKEDAKSLILQCDFDEGLAFPGREERGVIQRLGDLAAGDTREVELNLLARLEGGKNCLFTARAENVSAITPVSRQITITPQLLFLELTGPGHARRGETMTFQLTVRNSGTKSLSDLRVTLKAAENLIPRSGTGNPVVIPAGLVWSLDQLAPAESKIYHIQIECQESGDASELSIEGVARGTPGDSLRATIDVQQTSATPSAPPPRLVPPDVELGFPEKP